MRTILVPLDGSLLAESALPTALAIARRSGAGIVLVGVHEPGLPVRGGQGAPVFDQRWDAETRAALHERLDAARRRIGETDPGLAVDVALLDGRAAEALATHATEVGADLVVLTTHGRGGASRFWLGSVTDDLVRRMRIPIVVVHSPAEHAAASAAREFHRVLVPLDGTPESEAIVEAAVRIAGTHGVRYELLRVAAPLHPLLHAIASGHEIERDTLEQRTEAERALRDAQSRLRSRGLDVREAVRMDLQPARAILAHAIDIDADLIAIATHGRGAAARFALGSVTDKVLRGAVVPVLVHRISASEARHDRAAAADARTGDARPSCEPGPEGTRPPRLDRVVVAIDFGESSVHAAEWTASHLAPDAELVLVHAVWIPRTPPFFGESLPARAQLLESARREAELRMRELTATLGGRRRVAPEVREGEPVAAIGAAAMTHQADVIVTGGHGEHSGLAALLGSTTRRLLAEASAPVLIARAVPGGAPRCLLAALDDGADVDQVLAWVGFLGGRFRADVVLLYAVNPLFAGAVTIGASEFERARAVEQIGGQAEHWLERHANRCRASVEHVVAAISFGDPATEILTAAQRRGADLIVLGRGGAGRIARALTGDIPDRVVERADRPVFVVPSPREDAE